MIDDRPFVRRSNLLVPLQADAIAGSWQVEADAVTIDLRGSTEVDALADAVATAGRGGAELFVRLDTAALDAGLPAVMAASAVGLLLPAASAAEVRTIDDSLERAERSCGRAAGSTELILLLATARAVWELPAILAGSRRVSQVGLDEAGLALDLHALEASCPPPDDVDPFEYARGRLVVEARAAGVPTVGLCYPWSIRTEDADPAAIEAAADKARNLGMKGVLCTQPSWVAPVNRAFSPSGEKIAYNRRVRAAFAEGVAAGTAAVSLDGRMIDVPVDESAAAVLALAEACAARDAAKRSALSSAG